MASSTLAIIIILITIALFVTEIIPLSMTAMGSALAMGIFIPEMSLNDIYAGFGNSTVMMVAGMCVVGTSLFETGVADKLGRAIGKSPFAKNERALTAVVVACCLVMSAFLSNSGCIATWMPIIAAVAARSGGKVRSKMVIMAAGMACAIGGAGTLVGSGCQQVTNGIIQSHAGYEDGLGLFQQTPIFIPLAIITLIYFSTIGYDLTKKVLKPERPDFDEGNMYADLANLSNEEDEKNIPAWKGYLSIGTLIFCILGFVVTGMGLLKPYLNVGVVALIGATVLIASGCMPLKKTLREMDWNTLIILAAAIGFAKGLDVSGGGKVIANLIVNAFGGNSANPVVILAVGIAVATLLTNFMSNNAVAAMMVPIYIEIATQMNISIVSFALLIGCIAPSLAIATPVGTPCCTQTLPAGYKYMDYVKIGAPLCVILVITAIFLGPVFYQI